MRSGPGRPLGEISRVLLDAAAQAPGTVRDLALRSQVGFSAAAYTASRLVERGALVRLSEERPAVLGVAPPAASRQLEALQRLGASFWEPRAAVTVRDRAPGAFDAL